MKQAKIKTINILLSILTMLIFVCGIFLPINKTSLVVAESVNIKYELLSPEFNSVPEQTLTKYNIDTNQTSSFTPFDFETKQRMSGMSFIFNTIEDRKQIENQYVLLDNVDGVTEGKDYSLYFWIFFDNTYLHNLQITLELENSTSLTWYMSASEMYSLLISNNEYSVTELPYGYNKFELPFSKATINGTVYEQGELSSPKKMIVNYTSTHLEATNISTLRFYDIYLSESKNVDKIAVDIQGYRFYSLNFMSEDIVDQFCIGDTFTIYSKAAAINYAWDGLNDLYALSNRDNPTAVWKVLLKTPISGEEMKEYAFGDTITFNQAGEYKLYYQCYDLTLSNTKFVISKSIKITVNKLKAVSFGTSVKKIEVGKSYIFNLSTSSMFTSVSDYRVSTSSEKLQAEYLGDGKVRVTATEAGDYSLTATVDATRVLDASEKEYSSSISFNVINKKTDQNNKVFKIILWSTLGAMFLVLIIFAIKKLVQIHKIDVK